MTNFHFSAALLATVSTISLAGAVRGEELILDDLVVDGSACIGATAQLARCSAAPT
ncbi:hypothetical protein ACFQFQ_09040 [Sulfitobacter porphyrae]|uniref:Uncharacterized protein n=1 Tax=Sulfitobacter porphyrae TaxID=1246864 RepID=A0ABW2B1N4_9RHOB